MFCVDFQIGSGFKFMTPVEIFVVIASTVGIISLTISLLNVKRILSIFRNNTKVWKYYNIIFLAILSSLIGYQFSFISVVIDQHEIIHWTLPIVFLLMALFVFIITSLDKKTYRIIKKELQVNINMDESEVTVIFMHWSDKQGPVLKEYYPTKWHSAKYIEKVGFQLFNTVESIYGQNSIQNGQGVRLKIDNLQKESYLFFDSIMDQNSRGNERPFMLGVIAPRINYFRAEQVETIFKISSDEIKEEKNINLAEIYEQILKLLTTNLI